VTTSFRSRSLRMLKSIFNDALYRSSLTLLANTAAMSAIGFGFWALAAHIYPAPTVGVFSSVTSGVVLLATIAALGLPNTMIRRITSTENPRELIVVAVTAIATVGTALCLLTVIVLGPTLPAALHLQQHGRMVFLVVVLVVFTAVSGTFDAGLIAIRSSHSVLMKNLVGSIVKVVALFPLASFRSSGLLISYGLGLVLSTAISGVALIRRIVGKNIGLRSFRLLRRYLSLTSGNYAANVIGILPLTVVPVEVLVIRGATEAAYFAVAFLIAGFLNFIPSTVAQVLFAEASRQGVLLGRPLRKAIRGVYGLLLPALVIVVAAAPLLLRLFGEAYALAATGCLRVLALSTLLAGGTYVVDSLLIARDRTAAYIFMNVANAIFILGCVGMLLPFGLTAAAGGWALGQGLSLVLGLLVLATGTVGHHHRAISQAHAGNTQAEVQSRRIIYAFEPQIRDLLTRWPTMPTTLIAERIGWNQSIQILLDHVTNLRPVYSDLGQRRVWSRSEPGESMQCGLWFPPTEIPVGFGQTRSAWQLPVLTLISGYSRCLSAILIPSGHPNDLLAGLWELLSKFGAVPRSLTWDSDSALSPGQAGNTDIIDKYRDFYRALGIEQAVGTSARSGTSGLTERVHVYLERSFLSNRIFASPVDFNAQLAGWLDSANKWRARSSDLSPYELINTDRQGMLPLPSVAPSTGWRLSMTVGSQPFFHFDSNDYSLHPATIGRRVHIIANPRYIKVLCEGKLAARHDRAWAFGVTIEDPSHVAQLTISRHPGSNHSGIGRRRNN